MSDWDAFLRGTDWADVLRSEFEKAYCAGLRDYVDRQRAPHPDRIYPPQRQVDAALKLTPLADTRVVILGQDPYAKFGQAHGLSFSVPRDVPPPPSLVNIFLKLQDDFGFEPPRRSRSHPANRTDLLYRSHVAFEQDLSPFLARGDTRHP